MYFTEGTDYRCFKVMKPLLLESSGIQNVLSVLCLQNTTISMTCGYRTLS